MMSIMKMTKKRQNGLTLLLLIILASLVAYFLFYRRHTNDEVFVQARPFKGQHGWGYDILTGEKTYIHQEFIPAVGGKKAFETEADAQRTGNLVVMKIRNKELPTLTFKDLKELGIVKDTTLSH